MRRNKVIIGTVVAIGIVILLIMTSSSGMSNQSINTRANLGLTKKPAYHDAEGATFVEYGLTDKLAQLKNLAPLRTLKSGFEGLATTKNVNDPWRQANPYTMVMR